MGATFAVAAVLSVTFASSSSAAVLGGEPPDFAGLGGPTFTATGGSNTLTGTLGPTGRGGDITDNFNVVIPSGRRLVSISYTGPTQANNVVGCGLNGMDALNQAFGPKRDDGAVDVGEPVGRRSVGDVHGHRHTRSGLRSAPLGFRSAARPQEAAEAGSISFSDGDRVLAIVPVEAGRAVFATSSLTAGTHMITAAYSGTAIVAPSSATITQEVDHAATLPVTR